MRPIDMYTGSISPLSTNINISAGISVATVGQRRHRFEGCKLTGPGINIPTNSFPDGAPVVTRVTVNPNELVSSVNSEKGVFSTDRDKEITIKEEPEIIVSENDPTEIVNKSNSVSNSSLLKKGNTENQIQSPPVIKQTTTKSSNYKSNRRN